MGSRRSGGFERPDRAQIDKAGGCRPQLLARSMWIDIVIRGGVGLACRPLGRLPNRGRVVVGRSGLSPEMVVRAGYAGNCVRQKRG